MSRTLLVALRWNDRRTIVTGIAVKAAAFAVDASAMIAAVGIVARNYTNTADDAMAIDERNLLCSQNFP